MVLSTEATSQLISKIVLLAKRKAMYLALACDTDKTMTWRRSLLTNLRNVGRVDKGLGGDQLQCCRWGTVTG